MFCVCQSIEPASLVGSALLYMVGIVCMMYPVLNDITTAKLWGVFTKGCPLHTAPKLYNTALPPLVQQAPTNTYLAHRAMGVP
jgi:ACR3 family arsenite efflux pump ArsB